MQKYFNNLIDSRGNVLEGVSVRVYVAGSNTLASLYSDDGVTPTSNPQVTDDLGYFSFYVITGSYDLKVSGKHVSTYWIRDVLISDEVADYASSAGSSLIGFQQTGTGAVARTLQAKDRETVSITDFGADPSGVADSTAAIQSAIDSGAAKVIMPKGTFLYSNIVFKPTVREFVGAGATASDTYLKRKAGATSAAFAGDGTNRNTSCFVGHFRMDGNSEAAETYGLDLSGFSYSTFENIWVRLFKLDGVFVDGSITPTNKQFSNNTFINVRSNQNLRDGYRFTGGILANSANTYVGCEAAGNGAIGFNEINGFSNQTVGCCFQNNTTRNFYSNGTLGRYDIYSEGMANALELGAQSTGNSISTRTEYPLWNTFVDGGERNIVSVRGERQVERDLFDNPYFTNWTLAAPVNVALNSAPTIASFADAGSPAGADLQVTINANFQGFFFSLMEGGAALQGKWVTLLVDVDTSGVVDPLVTRVYTRDGATTNSTAGAFANMTLPVTASGTYKTVAFDVKFADTVAGTPTVAWYVAYSGVAGTSVVKIRSARILAGQTRSASRLAVEEKTPSITAVALGAATNGINVHRKTAGKLVYDSTAGKMRFALSTASTSAWRATDGTGDITPA